jgi:DNA polymerase III epsilon subunit-like protein
MYKKSSGLPDLAFVDVETLGLNPEKHRVIEIAVSRVPFDVKKWPASPEILVRRFTPSAEDLAQAEPGALRVNGYHAGHPEWSDAVPDQKGAWQMLNSLVLRDAVLVSQNVPFDRGFMEAELRRAGVTNPFWARRFIDIQSYSALIAMEKGLSKWGLHDVYSALGLPALQEHRAAADVQRGMAVFEYVYDRVMKTA